MHLIITAERISNMGGLSPELKLRLGDLLIMPVASFGCQIWGVNFLDLSKGVDGNDLERIHLSYLRQVLGIGMNIAGDILRAESSSPPYHVHWTKLIFRLWNSLQSNNNIMARDIWKDDITLFLKGCRTCWSYKVEVCVCGRYHKV